MIYLLVGNDLKKKNAYIKKITQDNEVVFLTESKVSKEILNNYAMSNSLFGSNPFIIVENLIGKDEVFFSSKELSVLKNSKTTFIFLEDKILLATEKKYREYVVIEKFTTVNKKEMATNSVFNIADAFARKDKIKTWVLYSQAIENKIGPEAISGMLFWKIKTMILNNNQLFSLDILKKQSSEIVSLYHRAHRGEIDFVVGLEQFILKALS